MTAIVRVEQGTTLMETVPTSLDDVEMELVMNLVAGFAGLLFALVALYSVAAIWSDELP
ncbi:hypothetical protein BH23ACT4_BH23ACT4_11760 [soil metagenome]